MKKPPIKDKKRGSRISSSSRARKSAEDAIDDHSEWPRQEDSDETSDPNPGRDERPPRKGQWAQGTSGNPTGRRKGLKNKRTVIIQMMEERLGKRIPDPSRLSRYEGMIFKHIQQSLAGDVRSFNLVLAEYRKAIESSLPAAAATTEEDQKTYELLVARIRRDLELELRKQIRIEILKELGEY